MLDTGGVKGKRVDGRCSFCGKKRDEVRKLVAGPGVFICDECVALCSEVINTEGPSAPADQSPRRSTNVSSSAPWWRRLFHIEVAQPA